MGAIGFGELVLLAGIALVVIGPDKFPEFAKIVLRTIRDLKGYVNEVKEDIAEELRPVQNEVRQLSRRRPEEFLDALTRAEDPARESGPPLCDLAPQLPGATEEDAYPHQDEPDAESHPDDRA